MKSKRNLLKTKKQQLCERINQCKSLKELEGWRRTFSYHPVLKDDQDWDYEFFLDLIEFKLRNMREYFWTHNIVENEKQYGDICDKLINILHAGYKTTIIISKDLHNYVNTKNSYRFINSEHLFYLKNDKLKDAYYLPEIRAAKAKALFWKYLHHNIEKLWDLYMDNIESNNKLFRNDSIFVILKQFKEEHISESETVQLIEDLYRNRWPYYIPYTPWPQITYDNNFPKFEITCTK